MKKINKKLIKQAEKFVKEVCIDTWQMSDEEIKNYCLMIVKQNMAMAKINNDYLKTAAAYAPFANVSAEKLEKLIAKEVTK